MTSVSIMVVCSVCTSLNSNTHNAKHSKQIPNATGTHHHDRLVSIISLVGFFSRVGFLNRVGFLAQMLEQCLLSQPLLASGVQ